jgi:hypothetical protein
VGHCGSGGVTATAMVHRVSMTMIMSVLCCVVLCCVVLCLLCCVEYRILPHLHVAKLAQSKFLLSLAIEVRSTYNMFCRSHVTLSTL